MCAGLVLQEWRQHFNFWWKFSWAKTALICIFLMCYDSQHTWVTSLWCVLQLITSFQASHFILRSVIQVQCFTLGWQRTRFQCRPQSTKEKQTGEPNECCRNIFFSEIIKLKYSVKHNSVEADMLNCSDHRQLSESVTLRTGSELHVARQQRGKVFRSWQESFEWGLKGHIRCSPLLWIMWTQTYRKQRIARQGSYNLYTGKISWKWNSNQVIWFFNLHKLLEYEWN